MKDRSVWPECGGSTHDRCGGTNATSECICWHHVVQQRQIEHAMELFVDIAREVEAISELMSTTPSSTSSVASNG